MAALVDRPLLRGERRGRAPACSGCWRRSTPAPLRSSRAIQGYALGGGCRPRRLLPTSRSPPRTRSSASRRRKLGIVPAVISPFVLARIGRGAARRYFLTGERFGAATALAHRPRPRGRARPRRAALESVVADLLAGGPEAVRAAKRLVRDATGRRRDRPGSPHGCARARRARRACAPSSRRRAAGVEIRKLLVANRGEIAARVFRTCRPARASRPSRSPRRTTSGALHTRVADETRRDRELPRHRGARSGPPSTGADAIHPGYGFLAESPDFAEAVEAAGLVCVGPPPQRCARAATSSRRSGSPRKPASRSLPPGRPSEIGFPLVVKAAAGGGGRGMRIVREPGGARRGARRGPARGEGRLRRRHRLLRALRRAAASRRGPAARRRARHGALRWASASARSSAATRRCSRSPPPPRSMLTYARASARPRSHSRRAIGYRSAGTAEFMLDGRDFYFLELNGRIQVEHPVTELVTGLDLVEEQLRIAAGEHLDLRPERRRVMPSRCGSTPRIRGRSSRRPAGSSGSRLPTGIRVDAGVEEGDEVGVAYDPMIAKLIAHGPTRDEALLRLRDALAETRGRRADDESPVPALAGRPSRCAGRPNDNGVPRRVPAAVGAPCTAAERPVGRRLAPRTSLRPHRTRPRTRTTRRTLRPERQAASKAPSQLRCPER